VAAQLERTITGVASVVRPSVSAVVAAVGAGGPRAGEGNHAADHRDSHTQKGQLAGHASEEDGDRSGDCPS